MCFLCGMDDHADGLSFEDVYGNIPELTPGQNKNNIPKELQDEWKAKGWCPQCGKPGYFSHCQYVCKDHGPY